METFYFLDSVQYRVITTSYAMDWLATSVQLYVPSQPMDWLAASIIPHPTHVTPRMFDQITEAFRRPERHPAIRPFSPLRHLSFVDKLQIEWPVGFPPALLSWSSFAPRRSRYDQSRPMGS